ncbi:MAG TPA: DUF5985 family protein [Terriglobales bacterium]|nr:DUF5985 family protein [Terriglobales bacterium]
MMAAAVYILGALLALLCALLLLRGYLRGRQRLLLWSGLCFLGLSISNVLVFFDLVVLREGPDLYLARLITAAVAMLLMLYGLIWEAA